MQNYVRMSLETHLFFARIMKEHALFLQAGFPAGETEYIRKAECLREQFEKVLEHVVMLADGMVGEDVLSSGEVVTEFTEMAERETERLAGIPIDIRITQAEKRLRAGCPGKVTREIVQRVQNLNQKVLCLLKELIAFKERILREVLSCNLYTTNYPLLIEHILREARLYRQTVAALEQRGCMPLQDMREREIFWNRIMMEHAQFIRGLLDPTECELLETADGFVGDYCKLLEKAKEQDCRAMEELTRVTFATTEKYRDFKAAGAKGIIGCQIRSIIVPLLADHVLREANHYLRILKN